jgi:hypothetical protein
VFLVVSLVVITVLVLSGVCVSTLFASVILIQ